MALLTRPDGPSGLTITIDDRTAITAAPGQTVAGALIAAGVLMTSRSPKYRRPRGPSCLQGDCGTCLMRIDGRPNQRACVTLAREGQRIARQNTWVPAPVDPTSLVDRVFGEVFDHHHFMLYPRVANQLMQRFARTLTGFGTLPDDAPPPTADHRHHVCEVLVVGAGAAGRALATALAQAGVDTLLVDARTHTAIVAEDAARALPQDPPATLPSSERMQAIAAALHPTQALRVMTGVRMFAAYPDESILAAVEGDVAGARDAERVHTFAARDVVFCTGSRAGYEPFSGSDRPGVLAAPGLRRLLDREHLSASCRLVLISDSRSRERAVTELRARSQGTVEVVAFGDVRATRGSLAVEGVVTASRTIACDLVAVATPPIAVSELAALAGARRSFDGQGFVVARDSTGYAGRSACGALWAAGDASGPMGEDRAREDGLRVAQEVLAARRARGAPPQAARLATTSAGGTP